MGPVGEDANLFKKMLYLPENLQVVEIFISETATKGKENTEKTKILISRKSVGTSANIAIDG